MRLANPVASGNHLIWPPLLILIDAPFPSRLSRYTFRMQRAMRGHRGENFAPNTRACVMGCEQRAATPRPCDVCFSQEPEN